jgi:gliding motility-associated-like protein
VAVDDAGFWLTVTGKTGGCVAADNITVKVLKPVIIPNIFTPNGDGVNDTWNITNLSMYPACTVAVFNRYGQQVYRSVGYTVPWNGYSAGGLLPAGTYYYIIHLKNGEAARSGAVTILK